MPEFFATKYGVGFEHPAVRLLAHLEQAAIRFADRAITCTDQMRDAFTARGAPPQKIEVVLNAADETIFDVRRYERSARRPGRFRLICHGAIEERYGLDTILRAVALLRDEIPGLSVAFYGDGTQRPQLERLAAELGVADAVWFSDGWAPLDELLTGIADADAGVVAIRRDAFRDLTHCNKMFDYIAMRCPAIVSRTRSVEAYFDESCFLFFDSGDEHDLARAVRVLHDDRQLGERLARSAAEAAEPYRWARQREAYVRAFVAVANRRRRRATPAPVPTPPRDAAA
jgi:glycosyltransferase involved in cell wall biosynthesis